MSYDSVILVDTPVGYWPGSDTSGTTAVDASGNGHNGAYSGSFALNGAALLGDGAPSVTFTGGQMAVPDTVSLQLGASSVAMSVEAWLNATSLAAYAALWDDTTRGYSLFLNAAGTPTSVFVSFGTATSGAAQTITTSIATGNTYHVVIASTGIGPTALIYVNGALVATDTTIGTFGSGNSASGVTWFGNPSAGGGLLQGRGAKFAVYNYALSSTQVAAHYAAGAAAATPAALVYPVFLPRRLGPRAVGPTFFAARQAVIFGSSAPPGTPGTSAYLPRRLGPRAVGPTFFAALQPKPVIAATVLAASTADTSLSTTACTQVIADPRATTDSSASTDAVTHTLAFPRATADTSLTSESQAITLVNGSRSSVDTSLSSDAITRRLALPRSGTDTSLTSDVATGALAAGHFSRSTADTSTSADAVTRTLALSRATGNTSLTSDTTTRGALHYQRVSTDISLSSDVTSRLTSYLRAVSDTSFSSDSVAKTLRWFRSIANISLSSDHALIPATGLPTIQLPTTGSIYSTTSAGAIFSPTSGASIMKVTSAGSIDA